MDLLDLTFKVLQLTNSLKITLSAAYLPGRYNGIADRLSRKKDPPEWHLLPQAIKKIFNHWGIPEIDLFASAESAIVKRYVSRDCKDHRAEFIGAFSRPWNFKLGYVFPPPSLIPRVLNHLNKCRGQYLLVAPKSAVITFCAGMTSTNLSSDFLLRQVLRAISIAKPTESRPVIWDTQILLDWLSKPSSNLSFFEVSRRTAALLLLASGRRIHDLTLLKTSKKFLTNSGDEIILWPTFGSKTDRSNFRQSGWKLSRHVNTWLCPITWIRLLLKESEKEKNRKN